MQIARNDRCPCGSGKKYKHCCARRPGGKVRSPRNPEMSTMTLADLINTIQVMAQQKQEGIEELGVFLLFADRNGDAWLLEVTEADCIQIASAGKSLVVPLEENEKTIVVDWSHSYGFTQKKMRITSHQGRNTTVLDAAPSQQLYAAAKRIMKRCSPELLSQVHIAQPPPILG